MVDHYAKYCRVLFTRYKDKVKYWLTFNEFNMVLHLPFIGAGIYFEEGKIKIKLNMQLLIMN